MSLGIESEIWLSGSKFSMMNKFRYASEINSDTESEFDSGPDEDSESDGDSELDEDSEPELLLIKFVVCSNSLSDVFIMFSTDFLELEVRGAGEGFPDPSAILCGLFKELVLGGIAGKRFE